LTDDELRHLRRCVELATEALEAGDEPFGSVLVAAHGWVGLGRIVHAASSRQLAGWVAELGAPPSPVRTMAIQEVVLGLRQ
jgi:hypothetical protein